jgi:hypothetical protein
MLHDAIETAFGTAFFQVPEIVTRLDTTPAFQQALHTCAADRKGQLTGKSIGVALQDAQGCWVEGRRIVRVLGPSRRTNGWQIERRAKETASGRVP